MEHSKKYIEEQNRILKELYSWNDAERAINAPISDNTRATLYFKGRVQDVVSTLYSIHELFYGGVDNDTCEEFYNATSKLNELADKYIIESISESMGSSDFKEI